MTDRASTLSSRTPAKSSALNVGIVGAGRSRNGLGPFIAGFLEEAGCRIRAVAGRSEARAEVAAAAMTEQLGHRVEARGDLAALAREVDALVIASPEEAHEEALQHAVAAGIPTLCEKPLMAWDPGAVQRADALVQAFVDAETPLVENVQWPLVLDDMAEAWPQLGSTPPQRFGLGLGPTGSGRAMLQDAVPHFVSVAHALCGRTGDSDATVESVEISPRDANAEQIDVKVTWIREAEPPLCGTLRLTRCEQQPRPAWLMWNDLRVDRSIRMPGYRIVLHGLAAGDSALGFEREIEDPLRRLVYRFAATARNKHFDPTDTRAVAARYRSYSAILDHWSRDCPQ